jgi:hypothetical protein
MTEHLIRFEILENELNRLSSMLSSGKQSIPSGQNIAYLIITGLENTLHRYSEDLTLFRRSIPPEREYTVRDTIMSFEPDLVRVHALAMRYIKQEYQQ